MIKSFRRRRWRETVHHTQFHARLEQPREATPGDDIGVQLMEALYRTIRSHTCTTCFARYNTEKEHTCGEVKCANCKEEDDLREHQCYIQPVEVEGNHPYLSMQTLRRSPYRTFEPNLLCYETSEGEKDALWGEMCCLQFIKKLEKMAWIPADKKKRKERPTH